MGFWVYYLQLIDPAQVGLSVHALNAYFYFERASISLLRGIIIPNAPHLLQKVICITLLILKLLNVPLVFPFIHLRGRRWRARGDELIYISGCVAIVILFRVFFKEGTIFISSFY